MASAKVQPHESSLYYEFSNFYDLIFRRVFYPRIAMVVRSLNIEPGARVPPARVLMPPWSHAAAA